MLLCVCVYNHSGGNTVLNLSRHINTVATFFISNKMIFYLTKLVLFIFICKNDFIEKVLEGGKSGHVNAKTSLISVEFLVFVD